MDRARKGNAMTHNLVAIGATDEERWRSAAKKILVVKVATLAVAAGVIWWVVRSEGEWSK